MMVYKKATGEQLHYAELPFSEYDKGLLINLFTHIEFTKHLPEKHILSYYEEKELAEAFSYFNSRVEQKDQLTMDQFIMKFDKLGESKTHRTLKHSIIEMMAKWEGIENKYYRVFDREERETLGVHQLIFPNKSYRAIKRPIRYAERNLYLTAETICIPHPLLPNGVQ